MFRCSLLKSFAVCVCVWVWLPDSGNSFLFVFFFLIFKFCDKLTISQFLSLVYSSQKKWFDIDKQINRIEIFCFSCFKYSLTRSQRGKVKLHSIHCVHSLCSKWIFGKFWVSQSVQIRANDKNKEFDETIDYYLIGQFAHMLDALNVW